LIFPVVFLLNLPQTARALCVRIWDIWFGMLCPVCAGLAMIAGVEIVRNLLPVGCIDNRADGCFNYRWRHYLPISDGSHQPPGYQ
jgi:hypothetical protein